MNLNLLSLAFFVFLFPLINFFYCIFGGRFFGQYGIKKISLSLFFLLTSFSYYLFYLVFHYNIVFYLNFGYWFLTPTLCISWSFLFDSLTVSMLLIVTLISFLVHIYSFDYMQLDPHFNRFISYLSLFTFFMLILISADNLFTLFVGWEGVGICSYLLVNFWFSRIQANKAAIKALLMNRLGDCGVLFGIIVLLNLYESADISVLAVLIPLTSNMSMEIFSYSVLVVDIVAVAFFIGTIGKSAQLGLHTWLPSAMEGPTPVSALIHAATMVTAGIFLIVRISFIFTLSNILPVILIFGGMTAIFAGLLATVQHDLKKIIAYSTCSQLGYMVIACGTANYLGGFFHLINHAFFKALLFLSAGVIIHYFNGEQDMRKMGQAALVLPFTYSVMLIATFAITGFPFLSGFYSKDVIIENLYLTSSYFGNFIFWVSVTTAALTAYYSWRLIYEVFFSNFSSLRINYQYTNFVEMSPSTFIPLFLLSIGSIFSGYFLSDAFILLNNVFFFETIQISATQYSLIAAEFLPFFIKLIPTCFSLLGFISFFILQFFCNAQSIQFKYTYNLMYNFFLQFGFFDLLYNKIGKFFLLWAYTDVVLIIEKGVLEHTGPYFFNKVYHRLIYFYFFFFQDIFFFFSFDFLFFYWVFYVFIMII